MFTYFDLSTKWLMVEPASVSISHNPILSGPGSIHQLVCVEWSPILPASFSIWAFYTDSLTCGNSRFFSLEMYWAGKGRVDKLVLKLQLQSKIVVLGFVFKLRS